MELGATKPAIAQTWDQGVADYDNLIGHGWLGRGDADSWKADAEAPPFRDAGLLKQAGFDAIKVGLPHELGRLEMLAMSRAERWSDQVRQYLFAGSRP